MKRTALRRALPLLALLLGLLAAGFGGWSYLAARTDEDLALAEERQQVLDAGRTRIATVTSLDARTPASTEKDLAAWLRASTGALRTELSRAAKPEEGTLTRGTVTDAAVTALDRHSGTAKLLATVQVRATPKDGRATADRKRLEAVLARTDQGWKLKALAAVPVGRATRS